MPVLGDAKTFKRLGYKKVRSKGKNTYTKDVRVKKIKLDEMQSDVQKKASGGSAELIKDIKPPSQGSGKAKIKKPTKPLNKEKKKAKVKKPIAKPLPGQFKYSNGGKVKTKKPKSRLLNPYIDFGKTKEFAKNEKAGSVVKTSRAKVGTTFGRNLDVGVTYDKNTYSKRNFKQKTKKTGVEATLAGQRGRITFSAGKQSQSNPYEGRSAGKYFNVQGRINLRKAEGGLTPKQSSQMDVDKDGKISSNDLKLKREGFARGGGIAIQGTKFNGIK